MTPTEQAADRVKALVEELRIGADDWGADQLMDQAADALTALQARVGELEGALTKIDAIRNSIIGCQSVNWSEHIYPLVAALNEAGFEGQEYESAREGVGTLIDRANASEFVCALALALLTPPAPHSDGER